MVEREYVNQTEAAQLLGISVAVLRDATEKGKVPAVQIGRQWLYRLETLRKLDMLDVERRRHEKSESESDGDPEHEGEDDPEPEGESDD